MVAEFYHLDCRVFDPNCMEIAYQLFSSLLVSCLIMLFISPLLSFLPSSLCLADCRWLSGTLSILACFGSLSAYVLDHSDPPQLSVQPSHDLSLVLEFY